MAFLVPELLAAGGEAAAAGAAEAGAGAAAAGAAEAGAGAAETGAAEVGTEAATAETAAEETGQSRNLNPHQFRDHLTSSTRAPQLNPRTDWNSPGYIE